MSKSMRHKEPRWLLAWFGVLLGLTVIELLPQPKLDRRALRLGADVEQPPEDGLVPPTRSKRARPEELLQALPPRELRRIPGMGETRAVRYAQARWEAGQAVPFVPPSVVHGIGPKTEASALQWAAEQIAEE